MAELTGEAKRRYVAGLFARIARRYDLMNTLMTGGMHHYWKRRTAALTAEGLEGVALDVATGTGDLAFALARRPGITHSVGLGPAARDAGPGPVQVRQKGTSGQR